MQTVDKRQKNAQWDVADDQGRTRTWPEAQTAVLMDIRDELQTLNRLLGCRNAVEIPSILRQIRANTKKPKRKTMKKPAPRRA